MGMGNSRLCHLLGHYSNITWASWHLKALVTQLISKLVGWQQRNKNTAWMVLCAENPQVIPLTKDHPPTHPTPTPTPPPPPPPHPSPTPPPPTPTPTPTPPPTPTHTHKGPIIHKSLLCHAAILVAATVGVVLISGTDCYLFSQQELWLALELYEPPHPDLQGEESTPIYWERKAILTGRNAYNHCLKERCMVPVDMLINVIIGCLNPFEFECCGYGCVNVIFI